MPLGPLQTEVCLDECGAVSIGSVDLFDRIAVRYDRANTMMTAGMDELWRVAAAD